MASEDVVDSADEATGAGITERLGGKGQIQWSVTKSIDYSKLKFG
jgi:hypothetical protein